MDVQTLLYQASRWNSVWPREIRLPLLSTGNSKWNAAMQRPFLIQTQILGSASYRWVSSLQYGVPTSGVSGSNDTKEYYRKQKIFLNHCFTQQPIERGYEVWLTVIFIHLMDFSTLQLGSIPTGRRLFSSVRIINNSYAAVSAICGSSADCLDLLTSLLVGFFQLKWGAHYLIALIILPKMILKPFAVKEMLLLFRKGC